jgi:3-(3-hydroxy-phenyl)propionate hydroxylase
MSGADLDADYDVVVVGCGPTGATLANLLGDHGLSVLVLERALEIYDLPRAVHFDDEVMRVFQWIGIADALADDVVVNRGMRFVDQAGKVLVDWPRPQEISANGWYPSYRFHQPDLERRLRGALRLRSSVTVQLGQSVEALQQDSAGVTVTYRDEGNGQLQSLRAGYVVGCDGARSMVRSAMGVTMQPLGFEQRWLVADVMLRREMPELGDYTLQFCDALRPATYCRNVGLRRRWEFALLDHEDSIEAMQSEAVWALLLRWITQQDAELERAAVYTFKSEVAESWVKGRLCLAGDCAHLTPPFLGQGMCAGIRDAANLAWKLAVACRGGDVGILTSYESERKPNVTDYIETAVEMGELINRVRAGDNIAQKVGAGDDGGTVLMRSVQAGLGPGLGSNLGADLGSGSAQQDGAALRGQLIAQITLQAGRLDDVIGNHCAVLARQRRAVAPHLAMLCAQDDPAIGALLDQLGVDAIFLRPDMRVLWAACGEQAVDLVLRQARALSLA